MSIYDRSTKENLNELETLRIFCQHLIQDYDAKRLLVQSVNTAQTLDAVREIVMPKTEVAK